MAEEINYKESKRKNELLQKQIDQLQTEIMNVQIKYQKELEKLEKENRDLRQQFLLMKTHRKTSAKKIKKSLIDMYCAAYHQGAIKITAAITINAITKCYKCWNFSRFYFPSTRKSSRVADGKVEINFFLF